MKIMILGDNRIFECQPGVTLGKIMDDINESLKNSKRIIRRFFLDDVELTFDVLLEKATVDVSEFETLTIESATFEDAAFEMLKRINASIPGFQEHLINTIESLKRFSPNAVQMFADFSDASASIFESIDNSFFLLDFDINELIIDDFSLRNVLDDIYALFSKLKEHLKEDAFKDESNLKIIIKILEFEIAPLIAKLPDYLNEFKKDETEE